MQFDKPKVTIDLDEYQHLLEENKRIDKDEMVIAAKKVIATILTYNGSPVSIYEKLEEQGIKFDILSMSRLSTSYRSEIQYDQISITLLKQ